MPALYSHGKDREAELTVDRNLQQIQLLTRIFPLRHAQNSVLFHFKQRQCFDGF
jgi:hypothetical protein